MNDESDLPLLTSIILGSFTLDSDDDTRDSNSLIMKSIDEMMILIDRSPFSISIQRRWIQFRLDRKSEYREYEDDNIRYRYS